MYSRESGGTLLVTWLCGDGHVDTYSIETGQD